MIWQLGGRERVQNLCDGSGNIFWYRGAHSENFDFLILFRSEEEPIRWMLIFYYFLTYRFLGENPAGYHAVNVLFHFFNSLLCARLFQILFRDSRLAALSGFLFAINCAPYEAVYWVTTAGLLMGYRSRVFSKRFALCVDNFSMKKIESFQSCLVLSRHFLYRDPRNGDAYGSNIGLSIV